MTASLRIDFVSDIACPWCAIGLSAFEQALEHIGAQVQAEFHIQPFELNPQMPPGGQDITEPLAQKYGSTPEQHPQQALEVLASGLALRRIAAGTA